MFKVERKMEMEDVDISEDAILGIQCPLQTDPKEQPFQLHLHIRAKTEHFQNTRVHRGDRMNSS